MVKVTKSDFTTVVDPDKAIALRRTLGINEVQFQKALRAVEAAEASMVKLREEISKLPPKRG